MPTTTIERVETELGWEFIQIYGLTETAPLLTINRRRAEFDSLSPAERAQKLGRAGVPALGVKLDVDDEGEVLARGNVVLEGYWQQPEETGKAIVDGWFHTGDLMPERVAEGVCPKDGAPLVRDRVGGRTTWWCPTHQR